MADRKINVKIKGDASGAKRAFSGVEAAAKKMRGIVGGAFSFMTGAVGAFVSAAGVAAGAGFGLVNAASDLVEAQNRSNVVFGEATAEVTRFAETSAKAFGISETAATEAAATFGQLLDATELPKDAIADMSVDLVQFAGDLSSFANLSTDDALAKVLSGLAGEIEPLRRVGVMISAAEVSNKALAMGLADTTEELTQADKVYARYALIMERGVNVHGDFARTSGEIAQQQRTLRAMTQDLAADVGGYLMPTYRRFLQFLIDKAPAAAEWIGEKMTMASERLSAFWEKHGDSITAALRAVFDIAVERGRAFAEFFEQNILPLLGRFVDWFKEHWPEIQVVLDDVFKAGLAVAEAFINFLVEHVLPKVAGLVEWFLENWPTIASVIEAGWEIAGKIFGAIVTFIEETLVPAFADVVGWFEEHWPTISSEVQEVWDDIKTIFEEAVRIGKELWQEFGDEILAIVEWLRDHVVATFAELWNAVKALIGVFAAILEGDWDRLMNELWNLTKAILNLIVLEFIKLPFKILAAIGSLANTLVDKGLELLLGFLEGAKEGWEIVKQWFSQLSWSDLIPGNPFSSVVDTSLIQLQESARTYTPFIPKNTPGAFTNPPGSTSRSRIPPGGVRQTPPIVINGFSPSSIVQGLNEGLRNGGPTTTEPFFS